MKTNRRTIPTYSFHVGHHLRLHLHLKTFVLPEFLFSWSFWSDKEDQYARKLPLFRLPYAHLTIILLGIYQFVRGKSKSWVMANWPWPFEFLVCVTRRVCAWPCCFRVRVQQSKEIRMTAKMNFKGKVKMPAHFFTFSNSAPRSTFSETTTERGNETTTHLRVLKNPLRSFPQVSEAWEFSEL